MLFLHKRCCFPPAHIFRKRSCFYRSGSAPNPALFLLSYVCLQISKNHKYTVLYEKDYTIFFLNTTFKIHKKSNVFLWVCPDESSFFLH